ncbi:MAG: phosphopantetheine-binding protein [Neomegalonema sp.]|nr:phosphopantetheine-binding protein [Neomegalonema sp.]
MSDQDAVAQKVIEIIAEQTMLEPDQVALSSTPEELGIDSLGLVEVVFAIEEAFDVSVPYNANDPSESDFDITSVSAVVEGVKRLIAEKG